MDRRLTYPVFGAAPSEYDPVYLDDMSRKLNQLITLLRSPGEGRQTTLVLTNLPDSDYGLETGALFNSGGAVRISVPYAPSPAGLGATAQLGTVTVTTV